MAICSDLRSSGIHAETDTVGRSLKAQMKYADKIGAKYTAVIGSDELKDNKAKVKNMETGVSTELSLENFEDNFLRLTINEAAGSLADDSDMNISLTDLLGNIN